VSSSTRGAEGRSRHRRLRGRLESLSQYQLAWRKFKKHRLALVGLGILAALFIIAIVGPFIWPFDFRTIPGPTRSSRSAGRRRWPTRSARPAACSVTS
jgi:hypothetical protein